MLDQHWKQQILQAIFKHEKGRSHLAFVCLAFSANLVGNIVPQQPVHTEELQSDQPGRAGLLAGLRSE